MKVQVALRGCTFESLTKALMQDDSEVQCPWCGEWMTLWIAMDEVGTMTVDCEVCCRPWSVSIQRDFDGRPNVTVGRE